MESMKARHTNVALSLFSVIVLCGCPSPKSQLKDLDSAVKKMNVPDATILSIQDGASLDTLKGTLGIAAQQEFTIATNSGNYTLIKCPFHEGESYIYLLFCGKTLLKMIDSSASDPNTLPPAGMAMDQIKSSGLEYADGWIVRSIQKTLAAPAMTHAQIVDYLKPYSGPPSDNNLPPFLVNAVMFAGASRMNQDAQAAIVSMQKYDGCLTSLGMSTAEVKKLYGQPTRIITTKDSLTIWIYQDSRTANQVQGYVNLSVVFDPLGHVSAIYNDDFTPDAWKKPARANP